MTITAGNVKILFMKNILITGALGGMGKATCKLLSDLGYVVYGVDAYDCQDFCGEKYFTANLCSLDEIKTVKEQIKNECSHLDAIIHMAGIYRLDSLVEMSEEEFTKVFNVNLFSVYRVNKTFLPLLKKGSKIIITSSELAPLDPLPFTGIYAITKSAVEKYAYSLRMELNLLGINVSVIRPGAVKTGLLHVSTACLEKFCETTTLYPCNAEKFKKIVESVETKNVPPEKIAKIASKALTKKRPKYVYNVNRNKLLKILSFLPDKLQVKIIGKILKEKKKEEKNV